MQADSKEQLKWCAFFIQPNEIRIKKNSPLRIFTEANDMNTQKLIAVAAAVAVAIAFA